VEAIVKDEEKKFLRERQKKYKEDLDKQYSEASAKNSARGKKEPVGGAVLGLDNLERDKHLEIKRRAIKSELLREIQERHDHLLTEREREKTQKVNYESFLKQLEDVETRKKLEEKERKQYIASDLRSSYLTQEQQKKQKVEVQKTMDRKLLEQEKMKWPLVDYEKKKAYLSYLIAWIVKGPH
jgi:hypothetical protein